MSGAGKIETQRFDLSGLSALLYNFDVGRRELKPEHLQWIRTVLLPWSAPKTTKTLIIGMTSRTGSEKLNWTLSKARADAVSWELFRLTRKTAPATVMRSGETAARLAGVADDTEHDRWRAVFVNVSDDSVASDPDPELRFVRLVKRPLSITYLLKEEQKNFGGGEPGERAYQAAQALRRELSGPRILRLEEGEVDQRFVLQEIILDNASDASGVPFVAEYVIDKLRITYKWDARGQQPSQRVKLTWMQMIFKNKAPGPHWRYISPAQADEFIKRPWWAYNNITP